jgi:hypothetical protein
MASQNKIKVTERRLYKKYKNRTWFKKLDISSLTDDSLKAFNEMLDEFEGVTTKELEKVKRKMGGNKGK